MKYLKGLLNFYINSSIHVALAAYALTWVTLIQLHLEYEESSLYFVFYGTIVAYNFVKYFGLVKFHHRKFTSSLQGIQIISALAFTAMFYYVIQLNSTSLILAGVITVITFFYAIPFVPKRLLFDEQRNLRQISGLKIYVIALVWALTTVLLPIINNSIEINTDVVISFVQRGLYVIVLMLPFEIRDLKYDNLKLATVPQKIGVRNTKLLGSALLLLFVLCEMLKSNTYLEQVIITAVLSFITLLLLLLASKNQSNYYSAFWVEGLPILWLLLLLVFG